MVVIEIVCLIPVLHDETAFKRRDKDEVANSSSSSYVERSTSELDELLISSFKRCNIYSFKTFMRLARRSSFIVKRGITVRSLDDN